MMWNSRPDCANKVSEQVCLDRAGQGQTPWANSSALLCSLMDLKTNTEIQGRESLAWRASDNLLLICCQVLSPVGLSGFTNNTVQKWTQRSSCALRTLFPRLQWVARKC